MYNAHGALNTVPKTKNIKYLNIPEKFFKIMCLCYASLCVVQALADAHKGQKKESEPLKPEVEMVLSSPTRCQELT